MWEASSRVSTSSSSSIPPKHGVSKCLPGVMSGNCADSSSLPGLIKDISWKKIAGAIPAPLPPPKILHPFSLLRLKAGKWGSLGSGNGDAAQMKFGEAQEGSSTLWSKMSFSEGAILPSGRVLWQHRRCKCSGAAAAQTCHRVAPSLETKQLFLWFWLILLLFAVSLLPGAAAMTGALQIQGNFPCCGATSKAALWLRNCCFPPQTMNKPPKITASDCRAGPRRAERPRQGKGR